MSKKEENNPLEPWIDTALEARVIALILGEASAFEEAELNQAMDDLPELKTFYLRMKATHKVLKEVKSARVDPTKGPSQMSSEKRNAVLKQIGGLNLDDDLAYEGASTIGDETSSGQTESMEELVKGMEKPNKTILLGIAVGLTSLIMIALSYWVIRWGIRSSFHADSAEFVITDTRDAPIQMKSFQQSVRQKSSRPSSGPDSVISTSEPSPTEVATIDSFGFADFEDRPGAAGGFANGLESQNQLRQLSKTDQESKKKPESNLSKRGSSVFSVTSENAAFDITDDPFSAPEPNASSDDPFAAPGPTVPSSRHGLAKRRTTTDPEGQTLRGRVEIAGQANEKGKLSIEQDEKESEQLRRANIDKESNLTREPDKLGRITRSKKELADKELLYSEFEVRESAEKALQKIDAIKELKGNGKFLQSLEEGLITKTEKNAPPPKDETYASDGKKTEDKNRSLFFNSENGAVKFKAAKRDQLNAKIKPGSFDVDYGYIGNKAALGGGGGFVAGKISLIDDTEKQLANRESGSFFSGTQKEVPFARHQIKSNVARKLPSKPKQHKSSPETLEEAQAELSEVRSSEGSVLWFGKTAVQGQQQGTGQGKAVLSDGIIAAGELKGKKLRDPIGADTGAAVLNYDSDADLNQQLSATGGIALKKKRLTHEYRSKITNLGERSRSDADGAETSILGRRPQPIITNGRKTIAPSPVTGIHNKTLNTEITSRQLKRVDLSQEKIVNQDPFSTFSLHVSDVSFKLAKISLLEKSQWPAAEKIRPEEFVNAFDYGDPPASIKEKISCKLEQSVHPFLQQRNLLRVSMRTAATGRAMSRPLSLTILLDKSGSMEREDREASVLRAVEALSSHLNARDTVTIISFARKPRLIGDRIPGNRSSDLIRIVKQTPSEGGTNLEEAIKLANQIARRQFVENGMNRIVLITDGAANLGDADPNSLRDSVIGMRQEGIAFDACGVGAEGINDRILESLTRKGDGRYYFLDRPEDADSGFVRQLAGALRPAARNVKVQVKFNPDRVISYKLTGFDKHRLKKEDFRDDSVDAAEMTSAEAGVALYHFQADPGGSGDVGQVFVRFQEMVTGKMVEKSWTIPYEREPERLEESDPSMQLAAVAGMFAEKLRSSPIGEAVDLDQIGSLISVLQNSYKQSRAVSDLISMIEKARQLTQ